MATMENRPAAGDRDSDDKESHKPKTRKLETIGLVAVEPITQRRAPEASMLHGPKKAHEHIGHMLVTAPESRPPKPTPEKPAERPIRPLTGKRIDTLSRAELLGLSDQIMIDGSSLRQIYETHLIGERGLRRLIAEHLAGGELKKALQGEIVEREIDFERDPILRDMNIQATASSSEVALNELLEKATVSINDGGEEAAFFKARARYEARQLQQHKKQRRTLDLSLVGVGLIMIALIIVLLLTRR